MPPSRTWRVRRRWRGRIVERVHEQPAHDVDHTISVRGRLEQVGAPAGVPGGKLIGRSSRFPRDVGNDLALIPDVVPVVMQSTPPRAARRQILRDAEARRRVLAVDRHEIEAELAA